jgi:hypothetical protein
MTISHFGHFMRQVREVNRRAGSSLLKSGSSRISSRISFSAKNFAQRTPRHRDTEEQFDISHVLRIFLSNPRRNFARFIRTSPLRLCVSVSLRILLVLAEAERAHAEEYLRTGVFGQRTWAYIGENCIGYFRAEPTAFFTFACFVSSRLRVKIPICGNTMKELRR